MLAVSIVLTGPAMGAAILNTAPVGGTYDGEQDEPLTDFTVDFGNSWGVLFWFKTDVTEDMDLLQFPYDDGSGDELSIRWDQRNNGSSWGPRIDGQPVDGRLQPDGDATNYADNEWHLLAYVYTFDGATGVGKMYVDGTNLPHKSGEQSFTFDEGAEFCRVFEGNKGPWKGSVSDYAFFGSADPLTEEFIGQMAAAGYPSLPEPATLSVLALGGLALIRRRR
jgi:hypothetical protein